MSLYERQMARVEQTTAFREKWGGVISPSYTEGADLSSNQFIGTATTQDVINTLINPKTQNRYIGSTQNLTTYLRERNWTPETAPTNWTAPEKQTVLRAEIAGLSQALVKPPKIKTGRPIITHSVNVATREQPPVIDQPAKQIITEQVNTPDYELTRHSPEKLTDDSQPAPNYLPLVAITIGAGVALSLIMKKSRGRKR
tara:strand:+ start:5062 stop:5658 length:597 start_codon:yes stop_codon:yes gene_type:complete